MKTKLSFIACMIVGLVVGMQGESTAVAADWSCCIYQGQHGLYCINWNTGNEVDCLACPRGPQDCKFDGPQLEVPPQS